MSYVDGIIDRDRDIINIVERKDGKRKFLTYPARYVFYYPDAKGKFNDLSASSLASWLIKTRKGNLKKIIGSLNQQVVFNRKKRPSYAKKMKTTMNIVRKRLGKDEDKS